MIFQNFFSRSDAATVRQAIQDRRGRALLFAPHLFADPAWDLLLELYATSLEQARISTSTLCERSAVPATTALRWLTVLESEGLIGRYPDPLDARRVFIELSAQGAENMRAYFELT